MLHWEARLLIDSPACIHTHIYMYIYTHIYINVCNIHTQAMLLMVGPYGDWVKYSYDGSLLLLPEGVRARSEVTSSPPRARKHAV